jgi:phosphoribosylanthranilate isomerase
MISPSSSRIAIRIKVCGITSVEDAQAAVAAGADAIGLVFYAKSPRYVTPVQAAEIARALGPFVTTVGLFVDADRASIESVLAHVPLQLLQFHGNESPAFCASFHRPFIKALRMAEGVDVSAVEREFAEAGASGLLLDSYNPVAPGGTGETFGWERIPATHQLPLILAGGLSPENVAAAVKQVKPYAVDVSSGVEIAPGRKDSARIAAFVEAATDAAKKL